MKNRQGKKRNLFLLLSVIYSLLCLFTPTFSLMFFLLLKEWAESGLVNSKTLGNLRREL